MHIARILAFLFFAIAAALGANVLMAANALAVDIEPGACIRCEAFGDVETCKRCVDAPNASKATVPPVCKAVAADANCKKQLNGECKPIGNPTQFLSCLKDDDKCRPIVEKCEAFK